MAVFGALVPNQKTRATPFVPRFGSVGPWSAEQRLTRRGEETLATGIGNHTGQVVAGNIGSEARMEHTVIGVGQPRSRQADPSVARALRRRQEAPEKAVLVLVAAE